MKIVSVSVYTWGCGCSPACVCLCLQFLSSLEGWTKTCNEGGLPSVVPELEVAIHSHQTLCDQVTTAYNEVRHPPTHILM